MEQLLANLSGKVQKRTLHGREYLVAPLSMIVPGVLNGSRGALFYPLDEISHNADAWNGMPIVVNHPIVEDKPVSARSPDILEQYGIGTVYNTVVNGKLSAEGWFDAARTQQIEPRVYSALINGTPIELSTGLFTENEKAADGATHNGVPYQLIARNYRPDHLAVLPDQKGACSLSDGCGVLVNSAEPKQTVWNKLGQLLGIVDNTTQDDQSGSSISQEEEEPAMKKLTDNERKAVVDELVANCDCWKGSTADDLKVLNGLSDEKLTALKTNHEKTKQLVLTANAAEKGIADKEGNAYVFNGETGKWDVKPAEKKPEATVNKEGTTLTLKPSNDNATERLTADERDAIAFANNERARQKGMLVGQLIANAKDVQKKSLTSVYEKLSINELQELLAAQPQAAQQQPQQMYFGAQGGAYAQTHNVEELDQTDVLSRPTVNWEEEARAQRGQDTREALAARNN